MKLKNLDLDLPLLSTKGREKWHESCLVFPHFCVCCARARFLWRQKPPMIVLWRHTTEQEATPALLTCQALKRYVGNFFDNSGLDYYFSNVCPLWLISSMVATQIFRFRVCFWDQVQASWGLLQLKLKKLQLFLQVGMTTTAPRSSEPGRQIDNATLLNLFYRVQVDFSVFLRKGFTFSKHLSLVVCFCCRQKLMTSPTVWTIWQPLQSLWSLVRLLFFECRKIVTNISSAW